VPWRVLGLFAVIVPTLLVLTSYVARRTAEAAGLGERGRRALVMGAWVTVALPFALRIAGQIEAARGLSLVGFGVGLACLIAVGFLVPVDVLSWVSSRWARRRQPKTDAPSAGAAERASDEEVAALSVAEAALVEVQAAQTPLAEPVLETDASPIPRRDFLRRSGLAASVAIGGGASSYGLTLGRHDSVREEVPIPLARLPRSLDGYPIAQLSDIHVGAFVGDYELGRAEELIRRARADLIVLTGDLVDHDPSYIPRLGELARRLAELGARDGVVAIAGNHDYYAGVDDVLDTLRAAGVRVLRNEGVVIEDRERASAASPREGFSLLGIDDVWAQRYGYGGGADLPRTLSFARPDLAKVLLCHNPELFPEAAEHVDLMLSGHTHGGQVSFLVRPADWFLRHGYIMGHYHRGASQLYVNRGLGTAGPPARVGTRPGALGIRRTSA